MSDDFIPAADFEANESLRQALRKPFEPEQIGKLPATPKRPELDYVGHAAVTDRLNTAAPGWWYTVDELFAVADVVWIRGTMHIGGLARVEYGEGKNPKDAIGNFIRRGAMRFGVAVDLWSKEELWQEEMSADGTLTGKGRPAAASSGEGAEMAPSPAGTHTTRPHPSSEHQPKRYPVDPATCDHKKSTGAWVPWDDEDRCPKCGTPKVAAMEGTTADLGPAEGYG